MTVSLIATTHTYVGVAADVKPTSGVTPGSKFYERDTGATYIYDGSSWGALSATGVLPAGENHVGQVGGSTAVVRVEKTRVSDANAYAANDAIDASTSAPTGLTFAVGRTATGSGVILGAHIATDQTTCVARFDLDLYDAAPAYPNDNAEALRPYSGAAAKFLQTITFPAVAKKTANSTQAEAENRDVRVPFKCVGASSIYGVLRTLDAFTPASGQKFTVTLYPVQD